MAKSEFTKRNSFKYFIFLLVLAIITIGATIGSYFYFGRTFEATNLSEYTNFQSKLNLGENFTLDNILEAEKYNYSWIKSTNTNVEVYALNNEDEYIKTSNILSYSEKDKTFGVIGISKGKIVFESSIDSSINVTIPFETKFSKSDTNLILKENYPQFYDDEIIDADELSLVTEITMSSSLVHDVSDFSLCPNLTRLIISSPYEPVSLQGLSTLNDDIYFYVTDGLYSEYMHSPSWSLYKERLFPIVNLEETNCTIVFEFNSGTMEGMSSEDEYYYISVLKGKTIDVETYNEVSKMSKIGHTFLGWYTNENSSSDSLTKVNKDYVFNKDTKLYANWNMNEYDIVYHDEYATPPASQHLKYDEKAKISSTILERNGYTFLGWSINEDAESVDYKPGDEIYSLVATDGGKIDLYAVWAANSYSIVYDANGGSGAPASQENISFDEEVKISETKPTREGYTFLGWSTDSTAMKPEYESGQTVQGLVSDTNGKVTLYAVWALNTYTIKYDANGGSNPPSEQTGIPYGQEVTLKKEEPIKTGYTFDGWSRNSKATSAEFKAGATVSNLVADSNGVVTLYAIWKVNLFEINYNANGGSNAPSMQTFTYDSSNKITTSIPSKIGYDFKGWSRTSSGSVQYTSGQNITVSEINEMYGYYKNNGNSLILYAVWEPITYTIEYNANGGKSTPPSQLATYDQLITLASAIKHKEGDKEYSFVAWEVEEGGTKGARYSAGIAYKNLTNEKDGTVKLKAVWKKECVATGTNVMLADGTQKRIETLNGDEMLLAWDFMTGTYREVPIAILFYHGDEDYLVTTLEFNDGSVVKTIGSHGFFDYDLNKFVYLDEENCENFIGHRFAQENYKGGNNENFNFIELKKAYSSIERTGAYSLQTAFCENFITEGMLSLTPPTYEGFFGYFEMGENMQYDQEKMQQDIEKYGLYTYEEWSDYLTYEQFIAFNGPYLKVAVGKGLITKEQIIDLILKDLGQKE